jgi:hypothetical protein
MMWDFSSLGDAFEIANGFIHGQNLTLPAGSTPSMAYQPIRGPSTTELESGSEGKHRRPVFGF